MATKKKPAKKAKKLKDLAVDKSKLKSVQGGACPSCGAGSVDSGNYLLSKPSAGTLLGGTSLSDLK